MNAYGLRTVVRIGQIWRAKKGGIATFDVYCIAHNVRDYYTVGSATIVLRGKKEGDQEEIFFAVPYEDLIEQWEQVDG